MSKPHSSAVPVPGRALRPDTHGVRPDPPRAEGRGAVRQPLDDGKGVDAQLRGLDEGIFPGDRRGDSRGRRRKVRRWGAVWVGTYLGVGYGAEGSISVEANVLS